MKPPRFRLRTLMRGVVLVAIALWVGLLARRSATHRAISVQHALEAASLEDCVGYAEPGGIVRTRADHHARLRDKYLRASRRPWLNLDDDPPIPDYPE
jgi:hypothetical protein